MAIPSIAMIPSGYKQNKVYSVLPTDGSGDLDFERTSTGTRVNSSSLIEEVGTGKPRLDYSDGSCPSLLLEPSSTNLITQSEAFDNVYWTKNGATVTSGFASPSADTPSGAFKMVATANNASVNRLISGLSNVIHSSSLYIKRVTGTGDVRLTQPDGNNLVVGVTSEWKRFDSSTLPSSGVDGYVGVNLAVLGDEVMIFGAQLEEGIATSLIPTAGTTVTRAADSASKSGISSLINSSDGVLYAEISNSTSSGGDGYLSLSSDDGTGNNRVSIRFTAATNNLACQYVIGGVNQTSMDNILTDRTALNKIAFKYSLNDFSVWVNGVRLSTDALGSVLPNGTLTKIVFNNGVAAPLYGKCKDLRVYRTALTDAELTILTTP